MSYQVLIERYAQKQIIGLFMKLMMTKLLLLLSLSVIENQFINRTDF
jgi:hypothetical protein